MPQLPSNCPIPGARGFCSVEGTGALGVLILGDCMDESEAYESRAFVEYGRAGALLERAIRRCGFSRDQFLLANVVPTCPPGGKIEGTQWEGAAVAWGETYLKAVMDDYKPRVILALGGVACRVATGMCGEYRSVSHLQNWVIPSTRWGIPVVPGNHPAFIRGGHLPLFSVLMHDLRLAVGISNNHERFFSPVLWRDMELASPCAADPDRPTIPSGYILYPSESDAFAYLRSLERDAGRLIAYDIETPRSATVTETDSDELAETQILSVQFSSAPDTGIFMPWRDPYIEVAKRILALPNPKAGANSWRFDDPMLAAHGAPIRGARHDVRWAFHQLQPDLKAALQFVASFYCVGKPGWAPWKHQHTAQPEYYGIRDVDAVQHIMVGDGTVS